MNVALYGGAFNPPHIGHIALVSHLSTMFDEVWVSPCFGHTFGKNMAEPHHRLSMCKLAFETIQNVTVIKNEIEWQHATGTYDLLKRLSKLNINFTVVIGKDNADVFKKWRNYDKLIAEHKFVVFPRVGCSAPDPDVWYLKSPHEYIESFESILISSTEIREKLLRGEKPDGLSDDVYNYIKTNGLYR